MLARSGPANIFIQLRVQGNYIKKKYSIEKIYSATRSKWRFSEFFD